MNFDIIISSGVIILFFEIIFIIICTLFCNSRILRILSLILGFMVIIMTLINIVILSLTGKGFDEIVYIQIMQGLAGTPWMDFYRQIIYSCIGIVLYILFGYFLYRSHVRRNKILICKILLILQCIGFFIHPLCYDIYGVLYASNPSGSLADNVMMFFDTPSRNVRFPKEKVNVVWIYAESLERTFMDEKTFPGLLPNLKKIEKKSISFQDIGQTFLSSSTITGLVASQCGTVFKWKEKIGDKFLPDTICIWDILKKGGYVSVFMKGATGRFANHHKFFQTHNVDFLAKEQLSKFVHNKDIVGWGITDDKLLELALNKYQELLSEKKPFFLGMSTVNTHFPYGHVPKAYSGIKYGDGKNSMLNAVHVSDIIISDFVKQIMALDVDHNTIIVISSDHLAKQNTASHMLEKTGKRRNLLMYILPDTLKDKYSPNIFKKGTNLDGGVTTLDMMGIGIQKIGLGRSLLRNKKTFSEATSNVDESIRSWVNSPYYKQFYR